MLLQSLSLDYQLEINMLQAVKRSISRALHCLTWVLPLTCSLKPQYPFALLDGLDPRWACPTVSDGVACHVSQLIILLSLTSLYLVLHQCFHTALLPSPVILLLLLTL